MKSLILYFLFLALNSSLLAQASPDSGFTNKADARNQLVNGIKQGKWIEYYNQGIDCIISTTDTVRADFYILVYYKDGKRNGLERDYSVAKGNLLSETPFTNGKLNGTQKRYYDNGKLFSDIHWSHGKANGPSRAYYENGTLMSECIYRNGKAKRNKNYDKNGNEVKEL